MLDCKFDQAQHPVGFAARVLTVVGYFEVATDRNAHVLVLCHFIHRLAIHGVEVVIVARSCVNNFAFGDITFHLPLVCPSRPTQFVEI